MIWLKRLGLWMACALICPQVAAAADFTRRVAEIPMRDGVTLHTVLLIPAGAHGAPILLGRTPFGAERRVAANAARMVDAVPNPWKGAAARGYILAFQDVRGRSPSKGEFVVTRPPIGPFNRTRTDETTDAWDTIDWLVRQVPETNGRVGMTGTSYDGFTVLMALRHPHPALKAAAPINPMVDGWRGDDWFHNGAFRQTTLAFAFYIGGPGGSGAAWPDAEPDDYSTMLAAGSAGAFGASHGLDEAPFWRALKAHPAYDAFWQAQALTRQLAAVTHPIPVLHVASLWDQEDLYGAVHAYAALERRDGGNRRNFLVLGPWSHTQPNEDGSHLGPLDWGSDTSAYFRDRILQPFLDEHLKSGAPAAHLAPVTAFETGADVWRRYDAWPQSCARACRSRPRPLYLQGGGALAWSPPAAGAAAADTFVSDPANPVPYSPRPNQVVTELGDGWPTWLVEDQRRVSGRPDVLSYATAPLEAPLRIAGAPRVRLIAATTGTDSDWVVKLIDVYPDDAATPSALRGYQLPVAMEIFRGRYRTGLARSAPIPPGRALTYGFDLPMTHHVFQPGHRIMLQVQSSWFPLYDRNPQSYVDNIFTARPSDYRVATQSIFHAPGRASLVDLPVVAPLSESAPAPRTRAPDARSPRRSAPGRRRS